MKLGNTSEPDPVDIKQLFPASSGVGTNTNIRGQWPIVNRPECGTFNGADRACIWIDYSTTNNCNTPAELASIEIGIARWERATDGYVHFEEYNYGNWNGPAGASRLEFDCLGGVACSSYIGRRKDITNKIWANDCSANSIVHEIGHTLGLHHEFTRSDRDDWVTINFDRIYWKSKHNFWKHENELPATKSKDLGPYDFQSIMNYRSCQKAKYEGETENESEDTCKSFFDCTAGWDIWAGSTHQQCLDAHPEYDGAPWVFEDVGTDPWDTWNFEDVMRGDERNRFLITECDDLDPQVPDHTGMRHEMSNDLYGVARLYTNSWYRSTGGYADLRVHNWHPEEGAEQALVPEHFAVGKFCDDEEQNNRKRPFGDDILWYYDDATDPWFFVCDGGEPAWHYESIGFAPEETDPFYVKDLDSLGLKNVLIGDFDGTTYGGEAFGDILINDPSQASYEWYIYRNGQMNTNGWELWNTHGYVDYVRELGVGNFCEQQESAVDVVHKAPDYSEWEVSCDGTGVWQTINLAVNQLPSDVALYDFNGDGRTDILRNNPLTYKLEIAMAAAGSLGGPVTYPNGFVALTLDNPTGLPGGIYTVDEYTQIEDMLFGNFRNGTSGPDGIDLFWYDEGMSPYWFVAASENLSKPIPTLRWEIHREWDGWDYFLSDDSFGGWNPQYAIVGSFGSSPDLDDILIKLGKEFVP